MLACVLNRNEDSKKSGRPHAHKVMRAHICSAEPMLRLHRSACGSALAHFVSRRLRVQCGRGMDASCWRLSPYVLVGDARRAILACYGAAFHKTHASQDVEHGCVVFVRVYAKIVYLPARPGNAALSCAASRARGNAMNHCVRLAIKPRAVDVVVGVVGSLRKEKDGLDLVFVDTHVKSALCHVGANVLEAGIIARPLRGVSCCAHKCSCRRINIKYLRYVIVAGNSYGHGLAPVAVVCGWIIPCYSRQKDPNRLVVLCYLWQVFCSMQLFCLYA